jgi:hypothetical protein
MGDVPSGSLGQLLRKSPGFEMGTVRPKLHRTEMLSVETAQALDGISLFLPASARETERYRFRGMDRSRSAPVRCLVSRMIWPWCDCRWPVTR